ncbi:hypothetical protein [Streptosporangium sp. NPDC000396]|uniref:hypothetical protein n=1 Tax=Streptosporangium sp. NPDC000396 TaxID=3366185 RepID=UPI0036B8EFC7
MVINDIFGVSGRTMLQAMIEGERSPNALAEPALGSMRNKIPLLKEALRGHFDDHHAFLCAKMLGRIDALSGDIAEVTASVEELIAPFAAAAERLDESRSDLRPRVDRRDRREHGRLPHGRSSGVLGHVRPHRQELRR